MPKFWEFWRREPSKAPDTSEQQDTFSFPWGSYVGQGGFGVIHRCYNSRREVFAAKTARTDLPNPEDQRLAQAALTHEAALIPLQKQLAAEFPELAARLVLPLQTFTKDGKLWVVYPYINVMGNEYALADVEYAIPPQNPAELNRRVEELTILAWVIDQCARYHLFHLDLTPASFFVLRKKDRIDIRLFDFGLAAFRNSEEKLTRISSGDAAEFGVLEFLSPERLQGNLKVGVSSPEAFLRSEVFSLALIAYEAFVGLLAYAEPGARNATDTRAAVLAGGLPEPRKQLLIDRLKHLQYSQTVQDRVIQVFQKALSKNPQNRYDTARAFLSALRKAVELPSP